MRIGLPIFLVVAGASTAFSLPRPNSHVQSGANHHLGDRSFVAKHGTRPDSFAVERERMNLHLSFVRDWLAKRPATRPELAARRAEILAHFDAYIAKNTTPKNAHVPWRTPVFIDDEGTICAVGYLIEQTAGRALPEKIATAHRYDFIEDIARDVPEVAAWVTSSGFTLEEIARIQPAYSEPSVNTWRTWNLAKHPPADGAYDRRGARGTFAKHQMEGAWSTHTEAQPGAPASSEQLLGRGTFVHGAGMWTSFDDDGHKLGEGPYVANRAHGAWRLFHPSGNLAAEGNFERGDRAGEWRFYDDTPGKTPIAIGKFGRRGAVVGKWRHFDATGALVATTWSETPDQWTDRSWDVDGGEGFVLVGAPRPGQVAHASHRGTVYSNPQALDTFALGDERIYVHQAFERETMYDQDGFRLEHTDAGWRASDCHWSAKRKQYAHAGDVAPLHGVLYGEAHRRVQPADEDVGGGGAHDEHGPRCGARVAVSATRGARLDKLLAARDQVSAVTPQIVRAAVLGEERPADELSDEDRARIARSADLSRVLEETMSTYLEWPHIDGKFIALFGTMPGRVTWNWTSGDPEDGDE